jgi:xylan 1,4-beta-xylosidase
MRKPGFHAYAFLNRLGGTILHNEPGCAVFRAADSWQVLLYNHHHFASSEAMWETIEGTEKMIGEGQSRRFTLQLSRMPARVRVRESSVDADNGWALPLWREMGCPDWPDNAQIRALHEAACPRASLKTVTTDKGRLGLDLTLQPLAMTLLEIEKV